MYVDEYYASYGNDQTQSAADLGADYAALNTAVDGFAAALLANGAANAAGIQAARTAVQEFDFDSTTSTCTTSPAGCRPTWPTPPSTVRCWGVIRSVPDPCSTTGLMPWR